MKRLDITNMRFGKLVAIKQNGFDISPSRKHIKWDCVCDCGNSHSVRLNSLRSGAVSSCGCGALQNGFKHGMSKSKEYLTWVNIKVRCYNIKDKEYKNYGGRGITVSPSWLESFSNFYKDMGNCPEGFSIDRINNDLGYCKENCRWTNNYTQTRNKRNNRFYNFSGLNMCITDWSKYLGVSYYVLNKRFKDFGFEKALLTLIKTKEN